MIRLILVDHELRRLMTSGTCQLAAPTDYPATAALEEELQQAVGVAANVLAGLAPAKADRLLDTLNCSTAGLSLERVGSVLFRRLESLLVLRVELEPVVMSLARDIRSWP